MSELQLMIDDNSRSCSPFTASNLVWESSSKHYHERITSVGIGDIEVQPWFNRGFASYPKDDYRYGRFVTNLGGEPAGDLFIQACSLYYERLLARDTFNVLGRSSPSQVSVDAKATTVVDGRHVSWDYLLSVEELQSIAEVRSEVLTSPIVFLDLGAGWGRLGQVLLSVNSQASYVVCDIPTSLVLAQTYLPRHLPGAAAHPYSETRELTELTRATLTPGMWFCGSQDLEKIADSSVNVFVNIFSFQEMTHKQTSQYFDIIDRVAKGGIFYSQQRLAGDVMTRENYPYGSRWVKACDRHTIFSPAYFEATYSV